MSGEISEWNYQNGMGMGEGGLAVKNSHEEELCCRGDQCRSHR
jgi:hypothetical protein